jgi:hypothetical protein
MRLGSRIEGALLAGVTLLCAEAAALAQVPTDPGAPALAAPPAAAAPPAVAAPPTAPAPAPAPPPVVQSSDPERPSLKKPEPIDVAQGPSYDTRWHARGSMLVTAGPPGFFSDFGGEYAPSGGFWARGGFAIANNLLASYLPSFRAHVTLGYSGRRFALGVDVGGGAGLSFLLLGSLDAGLGMRLGRFNGVHANLNLYWYVFPSGISFPTGGEFTFRAPAGERAWFTLDLRGDMRMGLWGSALFSALVRLSNEPRGSTYLSMGLGTAWTYPYPGALLQVGYEYMD